MNIFRYLRFTLSFGILLSVLGLLELFSFPTQDGKLFGVLESNTIIGTLHILTGIAAILAAISSYRSARIFFQVFGMVYSIFAISGLLTGNIFAVGFINSSETVNLLHIAIASFSITLGFLQIPRNKFFPL